MIYVYAVSIPANTPKTAPLVQDLQLSAGTITRVNVQFPSGVTALAHVQLRLGLFQIYPTNPDGDFASSNETIAWDEEFTLDTGSNVMTFIGWNTDTVYSHTIAVRVIIQPKITVADLSQEIALLLAQNSV